MVIVTTQPILETYDHNGVQYRHKGAYDLSWSSFYSEEGGGYGVLSWREDRCVGPDYPDVGFLYEVVLRKGLTLELFKGVIVDIEESTGARQSQTITAVGKGVLLDFVPYNRVYQDQRAGRWIAPTEVSGSFVPNKFSITTNEGSIVLQPRRGTRYRSGEYSYVRYSMPFDQGIERIAFSSHVELPNAWPARVSVWDNTAMLWSSYVSERGTHALQAGDDTTFLELRFELTEWGEDTAEDGTVYGRFADVRVVGTDEPAVTIGRVARDLIEVMAPWGIAQDFSRLTAGGHALPGTVAFEADQTPKEILTWCAKTAGVQDGVVLAWGIDQEGRLYLEEQDQETIRYHVRRQPGREVAVRGSIAESAQQVYVVYTDAAGQIQRTAIAQDERTIAQLGGLYRRVAYKVTGTIDAETAESLAELRVSEQSRPRTSSSISVRDRVYSATGKAKAIDEVSAGGLILLTDFRAGEATLGGSSDLRDQWTTHQLVGVEINQAGRTARLIPAGAGNTFERRLAQILQERQEGI